MEIITQLRDTIPEFEKRGVRLKCVVQGTPPQIQRYCGRHGMLAVCIGDPAKESYRAMGLQRTSWWQMVMAPLDVKRRRREARESGCSVSFSGTFQKYSDVLQLPGAALIEKGGKILWIHRGAHPGDLPPARELLAVIDRAHGRDR